MKLSHFVRLINECFDNFFVANFEDVIYYLCHIQDKLPYLFGNRELHCFRLYLVKEAAKAFIGVEASNRGKEIVLDCANRGVRNLSGEIPGLAVSQAEALLALFVEYFDTPSHGVDLVCPKELQTAVCGYQAVPVSVLGFAHKEEPYRHAIKTAVYGNVETFEFSAELGLLGAGMLSHDVFRREILFSDTVLCIAHLYHSEIMAFYMLGQDVLDYSRTCEPAVSQHIIKLKLVTYRPVDHFFHDVHLAAGVLLYSCAYMCVFVVLAAVSTFIYSPLNSSLALSTETISTALPL